MIDGIKVTCQGLNPAQWRGLSVLDFSRPVSEETGEIVGKYSEAKRHGLTFRISDAPRGDLCSLFGSLHKHRNAGLENDDLFTFGEVVEELDKLHKLYKIPLDAAKLRTLEVGVNVFTKIPPREILRQAISHRRKPFTEMSRRNKMIGKQAERTEYVLKLYDKLRGLRNSAGFYVLRIEIRFERMRIPLEKCGVRALSDLQDIEKLDKLAALLVEACQDIIFFDRKARPTGLTEKQAARWAEYGNPYFWDSANLSRKDYYKQRKTMEKIREKGGLLDTLTSFIDSLKKAVQETRQISEEKGGRFPQILGTEKAPKKGTFSTLEYLLPNVPQERSELGDVSEKKKDVQKYATERRFCRVCGREITDQDPRSVFCSERLYGAAAKRCRNKESNARAWKRKKIKLAMERKTSIWITYEKDGVTESVQLIPQELYLSREWVDTVKSVRVSDEFTATGKRAQLVLWELQERAKMQQKKVVYRVALPADAAKVSRCCARCRCSLGSSLVGVGCVSKSRGCGADILGVGAMSPQEGTQYGGIASTLPK